MIVREYEDRFVLIEQDHHARISGEIMKNWQSCLFKGDSWRPSVEYAIFNHDIGWKAFDLAPFWNDEKKKPYCFIDFPLLPKTALYTYGIDLVEKEDPYAGLLCSSHYTRFMDRGTEEAAKDFVYAEKKRQQELIASIPEFNSELYQYHFALLRFGDDISLYLCLNELGTTHPFFRNGIDVSAISLFNKNKLPLYFKDKHTVVMEDFPFNKSFSVSIKQKTISKQHIAKYGLNNCYNHTPYENIQITLTDH